MWSKNKRYFQYFSKSIYLFSNNYLAPLNIKHLCQRFFQSSKHFWNRHFGIDNSSSFNSAIVAKCFPFIDVFSFGKWKKSAGADEYGGWLRQDYGFVFGQKLSHKHQCVSWCVFMVQNPWLDFSQFCAFLMNCFSQSAHTLKIRHQLWPF